MFQNLRLLFFMFFIIVQEINHPSCYIVYYEIKQRKKRRYSVDYTANPALPQRIVRALSSFVDTYGENNTKKIVGTAGENFYAVGGTAWYMDLFANHSRSSCWPETLTSSCALLKHG